MSSRACLYFEVDLEILDPPKKCEGGKFRLDETERTICYKL